MKVSYMDVDVDENLVARRDHHVLIPIGFARLDEDRHNVRVEGLASTEVAGLPAYAHGRTTGDFQAEMGRRFASAPAGTGGRNSQATAASGSRTRASECSWC